MLTTLRARSLSVSTRSSSSRAAEARVEAQAWRAFLVQPLAQGAPHGVGLVGREHHFRASSQAHFLNLGLGSSPINRYLPLFFCLCCP